MAVLGAYIVPHPPVLLPEVGKGAEVRLEKTVLAYREVARCVKEACPDVVVVISSHMEMYSDYFHIAPGETISGSMKEFGADKLTFYAEYDTELRDELCNMCSECGVPAGTLGSRHKELEHGTMLPLYFLREVYGEELPKLVRIGVSGLLLYEHYRLGMLISQAAQKVGKNIVVIASGDLSHRLLEEGPYGYAKEGPEYDARLMAAMEKADFQELLSFDEDFLDRAGECGHRCFAIMAGVFDCMEVKADKLSYEGPFGVGYGIVKFIPNSQHIKTPSQSLYDIYTKHIREETDNIRNNEDDYVRIARLALENFVRNNAITKLPAEAPEELRKRRAGAFVCIKKQGRLRGCIGTIEPVMGNIGEEIIMNAMSVAVRDNRFPPVRADELEYLTYSVDVMGEPQAVTSVSELDAKIYGIIVTSGERRGVLLPNLEGIDTVDEQIRLAKQKAGIKDDEKVNISRFEVERHM